MCGMLIAADPGEHLRQLQTCAILLAANMALLIVAVLIGEISVFLNVKALLYWF